MTDEQTAAAIVADPMNAVGETAMAAAIVRALQQARSEALDTHANAAVLRMCHEARMCNGGGAEGAWEVASDGGRVHHRPWCETLERVNGRQHRTITRVILGSIDIADASAIDRAIQRAATYAMLKERTRIYDAVNERYKELAATNKSTANMAQVLTFIDGPDKPTKGAVK